MDDSKREVHLLDHERRLFQIEREFQAGGRVTVLEHDVGALTPVVNEVQLANRVAAGVNAALDARASDGLNRWQRIGIAAGVLSGVGAFVLSIVEAFVH